MKKHWLHRCAVVFGIATVAMVAPPASAGDGTTFLWKVSSPTANLYLLGSIHAMKEESYPLPPVMEAAYDAVDTLVFEVNLDEMNSAAVKLLAAGSLAEGQTLENLVGPALWAEFESHLESKGFPSGMFQFMKPWMAALNLTVLEMMGAGYLPAKGLDAYFSQRAGEDGKDRVPLETVEFQVSLFADLTPDQSLAFFEYTLRDLTTMVPELDTLADHWRKGEVEPVEALLLEGFEEFPVVYRAMVTDRNQRWLTTLESLLAGTTDALVVVGGLHLVGKGGLVVQLEKLGYTVEQL
jgi:uncharacterized protein YbaP (TraB family)